MAIALIGSVGTKDNNANTSNVITSGRIVPIGSLVIVCIATNKAATSATDSKGNTYTKVSTVGTAQFTALFASILTTALAVADTITTTLPPSTDNDAAATAFSGLAANAATAAYGVNTFIGSTISPSVVSGSITTGDLVIGTASDPSVAITAPGGSWISLTNGNGAANVGSSSYQVAASTGTVTYNPTLAMALASSLIVAGFPAAASAAHTRALTGVGN